MTMLLSVQEAATLLGCSPRAVRARLSRGELRGSKDGGHWRITRDSLPLTAEQHRDLQLRADRIREVVEHSLPPVTARTRGDQRRTLADLAAFRAGVDALRSARSLATASAPGEAAAHHLQAGLVALGRAWPIFHGPSRLRLLDEARSAFGASMAELLMAGTPEATSLALAVEERVLPPLAGMCRAAEQRDRERRPRDPG